MDDHLVPDDMDRQVKNRVSGQGHESGGDHQRDVQHQDVQKAELQVEKQLPALGDGANDGAEIVVQQNNRGDFTRAAGASLAHGDADVRRLQGGNIVDAIPGDGHDLAGVPQGPDEIELLGRERPGHDANIGQVSQGSGILQTLAENDAIGRTVDQADVPRDTGGGGRMVAGQHDDANPGVKAFPHGLANAMPNAILAGQQAREGRIAIGFPANPVGVEMPVNAGQDLVSLSREPAHLFQPEFALGRIKTGNLQQGFRSALADRTQTLRGPDDGRLPPAALGVGVIRHDTLSG